VRVSAECPGIIHNKGFYNAVDNIYGVLGAVLEVAVIVLLLRAARRHRAPVQLPLLVTAFSVATLLGIDLVTRSMDFSKSAQDWLYFLVAVTLVIAAISYLPALLRERRQSAASRVSVP
jgi:hypothetical protein